MDKATVGRIVHFKTALGECRAAIVEGTNTDGSVDLHVFWRVGEFYLPSGDHAEHAIEGDCPFSWHWPERV